MKVLQSKWFPWALAAILLFLLLYVKCDRDNGSTTTIETKLVPHTIPAVTGSISKPTNSSETPIIHPDKVFIAGDTIYVPSPLDPFLKEELLTTKNAYQTLLDANRKREYSQDFNDDNVDINVRSTVYGRVDSTQISYKIKEKTIQVPQTTITKTVEKKDNFSWIAGGGANQNLETQKINYEAAAGIRIKDLIILGSANTDKQIGAKILIQF